MAALVAPVLSLDHATEETMRLSFTEATDGTSPYTYDLHRSEDANFIPDIEESTTRIAAGVTPGTYDDSDGLRPDTFYYYQIVVGDDDAGIAYSNKLQANLKSRNIVSRGGIGTSRSPRRARR